MNVIVPFSFKGKTTIANVSFMAPISDGCLLCLKVDYFGALRIRTIRIISTMVWRSNYGADIFQLQLELTFGGFLNKQKSNFSVSVFGNRRKHSMNPIDRYRLKNKTKTNAVCASVYNSLPRIILSMLSVRHCEVMYRSTLIISLSSYWHISF